MVDSDVFSCRLNKDEITYLNSYFNGKFSDFVHASFKNEIEKTKINKKKNFLQNFSRSIIMLGFGAIFLLFSLNINNLLGFLMVFFLGIFFMVTGLVNIFLGVKNKWQMNL